MTRPARPFRHHGGNARRQQKRVEKSNKLHSSGRGGCKIFPRSATCPPLFCCGSAAGGACKTRFPYAVLMIAETFRPGDAKAVSFVVHPGRPACPCACLSARLVGSGFII
jgi:hypothetical protein